MYKLSKIRSLESKSSANVKTMQKMVDFLGRKIDEIHESGTFSEAYKKESVQAERENGIPKIQKLFETVKDIAGELKIQQEFWESTPLVLSKMSFVGDAESFAPGDMATDATIRLAVASDLHGLGEALINLHFESALADENWPMIYQCYVAAEKKNIILKRFSEVNLPIQLSALLAIENAQLNIFTGEALLRDAHGTRLAPEKRLTIINSRDEVQERIDAIKNKIAVQIASSEKAA